MRSGPARNAAPNDAGRDAECDLSPSETRPPKAVRGATWNAIWARSKRGAERCGARRGMRSESERNALAEGCAGRDVESERNAPAEGCAGRDAECDLSLSE